MGYGEVEIRVGYQANNKKRVLKLKKNKIGNTEILVVALLFLLGVVFLVMNFVKKSSKSLESKPAPVSEVIEPKKARRGFGGHR